MTSPASLDACVAIGALVGSVWLLGRRSAASGRRAAPSWSLGCAGGGACAVGLLAGAGSWAPAALILAVAASAGWLLWRSGRRRLDAERRRARLLDTCGLIGADLAAGQPSATALARAAQEWAELAPAAEAAALGADVPAALRALSGARGAEELGLVAAAWEVAHRTGGGLASALQAVVDDLRASRETRRVVASELASARATARLVAALPLGVLALGGGAGGDPVGFLLHEPLGWACSAGGGVLLLSGLAWIEAIASAVDRGP